MIAVMPQPRMRLTPSEKRMSLLLGRFHSARRPAAGLVPLDLAQRPFEIGDEIRVNPLARRGARDDYIIGPRPPLARQYLGSDRPQPPLCPVAHYRIADLAAGGETNPHTSAAIPIVRLRRGLQNESRPHGSVASGGNTNKIGADLEPYKAVCHASHRARQFGARHGSMAQPKSSGRQALAAFRAPRGQHPAAAWRGHSRTKAMAALADELAGLVSALHGTGSNGDCLG